MQQDEVSRKWFLDFLTTSRIWQRIIAWSSGSTYSAMLAVRPLPQEESSQPFDSDDHPADQRPQGRFGWEFDGRLL